MLERHCFACGQQWPATCKCVRPNIRWQYLVTRLESDLQVLRFLAAADAVTSTGNGRGGRKITLDFESCEAEETAYTALSLALSRILEGDAGSGAPADAGQALVNQAPAGLGPAGFDPSRWSRLCTDVANARMALEFWQRETDPRIISSWDLTQRCRERGAQEIKHLAEWDPILRELAYGPASAGETPHA